MEDRKKDHIALAFKANLSNSENDQRFSYEPLLAAHPNGETSPIKFLGKTMQHPFWISSMTGGTKHANEINRNLAKVAQKYGLGMGLGSCRSLLDSDRNLSDFNVRSLIGDEQPFYTNLGIAQLEQLIDNDETDKILHLNDTLKADGLIIHINPLQEAFQPEGDRFKYAPIETIKKLISKLNIPIIVKEVGQGMGYESLKALLQLDIEAIEFGAFGGTNFTKLEQLRNTNIYEQSDSFSYVGHTAEEMTLMVNHILEEIEPKCKQLIISGGINNVLDGYYLTQISKLPAVIGMGSEFLKHAIIDFDDLDEFVSELVEGYKLASHFLRVRQ
ncbi:type 2 isopentenyl-diphosphate Delta-isomerase [Saccharicrinis aurantiacus]|uniref:type 2 isopentenyl-diphosphate Delta-isomerase n=1 Tax=Saccharicrinis aurantiacus TaxID=1849719 RepID=UPI0008393C07|nr:type 2 isopentenyl-diphosphate Delta-isomerase [Saccharicrinis aurantiacus]